MMMLPCLFVNNSARLLLRSLGSATSFSPAYLVCILVLDRGSLFLFVLFFISVHPVKPHIISIDSESVGEIY